MLQHSQHKGAWVTWLRMSERESPLFTWAGLPVAMFLALVLCWPMAATGYLSGFSDSNSYVRGGDAIWQVIGQIVTPGDRSAANVEAPSAGSPNAGSPEASSNQSDASPPKASPDGGSKLYGRSITYAAVFSGVIRVAGPLAMAYLQALLLAFAILSMITRRALDHPGLLGAGLLIVVAASQVAWMAVYLMPDALGAVVLVFAALMVRRFDYLGPWQKVGLTILAAFAASSHYGNIPLALAVVTAALALRYVPRGFMPGRIAPVLISGGLVIALAPLINMGSSFAVLGEMSMTPLRPPVVLARSLEDGPARLYLQDTCQNSGAADYCDAFGGAFPATHYDFLWGQSGLAGKTATDVDVIRQNEWKIVLEAAAHYPLQQAESMVANTAKQFVLIDATGFPATWDGSQFDFVRDPQARSIRIAAERSMIVITIAAAAALMAMLLTGQLDRSQVEILTIVVFGLVVNAFIFGALSAPAERYQARVAWLVPLIAVLFLAENGLRRWTLRPAKTQRPNSVPAKS